MALKGKQVAGKGLPGAKDKGKRKRDDSEKEKYGASARKRKNPGVLKFFDDVAAESNESDESDASDFINSMRFETLILFIFHILFLNLLGFWDFFFGCCCFFFCMVALFASWMVKCCISYFVFIYIYILKSCVLM